VRTYELMTIHRPEIPEDEVRSRVAALEEFLAGHGAKVKNTDLWGKRRFAYEIDHLSEGYYSVITFEGEPEVVDDLNRMLFLSDDVVRHKVVRPDA